MTSAGDPDPSDANAITRVMKIVNEKGLHARASAKFVQTVEKFDARVTVSRGSESAGGDSIISVSASGPEAVPCVDALDALVSSRFGEDE